MCYVNILFIFAILVIFFFSVYIQYQERSRDTNDEQLGVIRDILIATKPNEPIYDMVGSYVFRPDGYFICCHPYGEFVDVLKPNPPTLRDSLISTQTKFIVLDRTGQSLWKPKPDDLNFLLTNYVPAKYKKIYLPGFQFICTNGNCQQSDLSHNLITPTNPNTIEIIFPGDYEITTDPPGLSVALTTSTPGTKLQLNPGLYHFTVPNNLKSFEIRLSR